MFSFSYLTAEAIGNLGRDAKKVETRNGDKSMATFAVAVKRSVKTSSGYENVTEWVECVAFGFMADRALKLLKKGCMVRVSGEPSVKTFTRKNGEQGAVISINVENFTVLNMGRERTSAKQEPEVQTEDSARRDAFERAADDYRSAMC